MKKFLKNLKHSWKESSLKRVAEIPKVNKTNHITAPVIKDEGVDAAKGKFYANLSRFPEMHIKEVKPTVIISNELQAQITYLHNEFGNIEWSGFLLYKVLEGDLSAPETMVINAVGIFPCDVGSAAYTEYDPGDFILSMDDAYDFLSNGYKLGHIHTHHSMSCFFSGTDMAELHSNAPNYADSYYLSLIVNKSNSYCAKIAKIVTPETFKVLAHVDCKIKYEIKEKVLLQIANIRPKVTTYSTTSYYGGTGYRSYGSATTTNTKKTTKDWEDYYDEDYWDSLYPSTKANRGVTIANPGEIVKAPSTKNQGNDYWKDEEDEDIWNKLRDDYATPDTDDLDKAISDLEKFLDEDNLQIRPVLLKGTTKDETKERIFLYSFGQAINIQPAKTWYMWSTIELLTYIANYCSSRKYAPFVERWEKVFEAIDESTLVLGVNKIDTLFYIEEEFAKHTRTHHAYCANILIDKVKEVREKLINEIFEKENV